MLPELQGLRGIGFAHPNRGARLVLRGLQESSGRFLMMADEPGKLVEPIPVENLHGLSHGSVQRAASGLELHGIGHFLNQRMAKCEQSTVDTKPFLKKLNVAQMVERSLDFCPSDASNLLKY